MELVGVKETEEYQYGHRLGRIQGKRETLNRLFDLLEELWEEKWWVKNG